MMPGQKYQITKTDTFLGYVAQYLVNKYSDLSRLTLVFPNKRSATLMKEALHRVIVSDGDTAPRFMPRLSTMGAFVSEIAERTEMPKLDQLFLLYDCWRSLLESMGRSEQVGDFDRFIFWGDMILDDFDDIDRQLVDAAALFRNLKNLKEINADYLTDEQKQIVSRMFGDSQRLEAVTEFWTHINPDSSSDSSVPTRFIALWQILGELYDAFTERLRQADLDTAGGQYRQAAGLIGEIPFDDPSRQLYAFIGFNDLSRSEMHILTRLKNVGSAIFFWDFDSPMLNLALSAEQKKRFASLCHLLPAPEDFILPSKDSSLPRIDVISVASNIAQTKIAGEEISSMGVAAMDSMAIVLPDENLLTAVLHSLPPSVGAVNVTMGLPFSLSAFASMIRCVIDLQLKARKLGGEIHYYYADIIELLSHPRLQLIAPVAVDRIKKHISRDKLFNVSVDTLRSLAPELAFLFRPADDDTSSYMSELIEAVSTSPVFAGGSSSSLPEVDMLDQIRQTVVSLGQLIEQYGIIMNKRSYFALFERIMRLQRIDLQGTPLSGVQIMGVLETRALDFDNVVILSMNENVFPRRSHMRTMIPNSLRAAYGMTTVDRQDALYTYYFYRFLSRAKNVKLIYDSRVGSLGSGEASRFISQLRHIMPSDHITFTSRLQPSLFSAPKSIEVTKDPAVIAELQQFMRGKGNSYLSVSALKDYRRCRLRFYLRHVHRLRADDEITDYISPALYGTIVHGVIEQLFSPLRDELITSDVIQSVINDQAYIDSLISDNLISRYYKSRRIKTVDDVMPAEGSVTASIIAFYVRSMLQIDLEQASEKPFYYSGGEVKVTTATLPDGWTIAPGLDLNFTMTIDRIDRLADTGMLRFIDYKTGSDRVDPTTVDRIFDSRGVGADDAVFQLLTYCLAYSDLIDSGIDVIPVVYPFRLMSLTGTVPVITVDGFKLGSFRAVEQQFRQRLSDLVGEIFSPDTPFDQTPDSKTCLYCPFARLCDRQTADDIS